MTKWVQTKISNILFNPLNLRTIWGFDHICGKTMHHMAQHKQNNGKTLNGHNFLNIRARNLQQIGAESLF